MELGRLTDMPRTRLWHEPTPLERLGNLTKRLSACDIRVKRDDCNGLAFGGNKVRQMEYYLGDAIAQGADTLLITGAVQSNFVRTAAAACAKHGLQCHVQLEKRVAKENQAYNQSGNVLLDKLLGAVLHTYPEGEDEEGADRNLEEIASKLREAGRTPYVVHLHPSHPPLGALGYVDAALELKAQLDAEDFHPDVIFVPSGSGNTHGGFLFGLRASGCEIPVQGVCVRREAELQKPRIIDRLKQIAQLIEAPVAAGPDHVLIDGRFLAPGYGVAGTEVLDAIAVAATTEALILDPVYTGKTFAAMIDYAQKNVGKKLLFLHTGGGPSIFGYGDDMLVSDRSAGSADHQEFIALSRLEKSKP